MGLLIDGKWQDKWYDTSKNGGKFERQASKFRDKVSNEDGSTFPAESDRLKITLGQREISFITLIMPIKFILRQNLR